MDCLCRLAQATRHGNFGLPPRPSALFATIWKLNQWAIIPRRRYCLRRTSTRFFFTLRWATISNLSAYAGTGPTKLWGGDHQDDCLKAHPGMGLRHWTRNSLVEDMSSNGITPLNTELNPSEKSQYYCESHGIFCNRCEIGGDTEYTRAIVSQLALVSLPLQPLFRPFSNLSNALLQHVFLKTQYIFHRWKVQLFFGVEHFVVSSICSQL